MALHQLFGYTPKQIAEKFDYHQNVVYQILNNPLVEKYRKELEDVRNERILEQNIEAMKIFEEAIPQAAQNIVDLANNAKSETIKEWTNVDILRFAGISFKDEPSEDTETKKLVIIQKQPGNPYNNET